jgi:hypothetical protein
MALNIPEELTLNIFPEELLHKIYFESEELIISCHQLSLIIVQVAMVSKHLMSVYNKHYFRFYLRSRYPNIDFEPHTQNNIMWKELYYAAKIEQHRVSQAKNSYEEHDTVVIKHHKFLNTFGKNYNFYGHVMTVSLFKNLWITVCTTDLQSLQYIPIFLDEGIIDFDKPLTEYTKATNTVMSFGVNNDLIIVCNFPFDADYVKLCTINLEQIWIIDATDSTRLQISKSSEYKENKYHSTLKPSFENITITKTGDYYDCCRTGYWILENGASKNTMSLRYKLNSDIFTII